MDERDKPDKPPGKPDGPPGQRPPSSVDYVVGLIGGSFEWHAAEAIVDVSGGGNEFAIGLIGGLFGCLISDVISTEGGGGTRRTILLSPAPFSIEGAVGIIG
jgi:hypothetical protein